MWYILISIVVLGLVAAGLGQWDRRRRRRMVERGEIASMEEEETPVAVPTGCCGQHETCERDSLLAAVAAGKQVEYYDDEELDAYRGTPSDAYTEPAVEEFREVLYTLREADVPGWVRSLQLRGIALPDALKDETLLIVEELREKATKNFSPHQLNRFTEAS